MGSSCAGLVESSYRKTCKEHFWLKNQGISIWPSFFYDQFILPYLLHRGVLGTSERINICSYFYFKKKQTNLAPPSFMPLHYQRSPTMVILVEWIELTIKINNW